MSKGSTTTLWVRAFCDELARAGVRDVVFAPGSRSTPLVFAFDSDERFRTRVHLDERSAAFFALGIGKATGRPAAVVTTSGTATANVFPAVIEAAQSEVPLLVLTADRPHHLRDSDANQAIDQIGLYGPFVRRFFEVAPPTSGAAPLRHLRGLAARAVGAACGPPAGPVHLNFPFEKPLEPIGPGGSVDSGGLEAPEVDQVRTEAGPIQGRADGAPFVRLGVGRREADPADMERLLAAVDAERMVLVAGPAPDADRLGPALRSFSSAFSVPLLADPLSGARHGTEETCVIGGYDLFLRDADVAEALAPDCIVRVGASPTSAALQGWMQRHEGVRHVVIDGGDRWKDHGGVATDVLQADAADTLRAVVDMTSATHPGGVRELDAKDPGEWLARWRKADSTTAEVVAARLADDPGARHEGHLVGDIVDVMPDDADLFVSSSMPIRDVDAYGVPRDRPLGVFASRGASGIDGIISTAMGMSAGRERTGVCILGDVAFFHDQNGLLWAREADLAVVFVLIDNDGGGIFHMLPVAEHDPVFTRYFATPHGLDFAHTAALYGVPFTDVDIGSIASAVTGAIEAGSTAILRVITSRTDNRAGHAADTQAVAEAVRAALLLSTP